MLQLDWFFVILMQQIFTMLFCLTLFHWHQQLTSCCQFILLFYFFSFIINKHLMLVINNFTNSVVNSPFIAAALNKDETRLWLNKIEWILVINCIIRQFHLSGINKQSSGSLIFLISLNFFRIIIFFLTSLWKYYCRTWLSALAQKQCRIDVNKIQQRW